MITFILNRLKLIVIIIIFKIHVYGQIPTFLHYTTNSGLPSNLIHCGMQDHKGLLWFGTDKGLVRFNGKKFDKFIMKNGLPSDEVLNLVEDNEKRIWIDCFADRLCYFKDNKIVTNKTNHLLKEMVFPSGISNIFEDNDKSIYFTNITDVVYKISNGNVNKLLFPSSIMQIIRVDSVLLALGSGYVYRIDSLGNISEIYNIVNELGGIPKYSGSNAHNKMILYSFLEKTLLFKFSNSNLKVVSKQKGPIGRAFVDKKGRFWICSASIGAICFSNNKNNLSNPEIFLPGKKVSSMFEDYQGTLWFCTLNDGIYGLPKESPMVYDIEGGLPNQNIISISKYNQGQVICGDDEGNLCFIKTNNFFSIKRLGSADGYNRVINVVEDKDNAKWIITDEALYFSYFDQYKNIKINTTPKSILIDNEFVWIGSSSRLYRLNKKNKSRIDEITSRRITALGKDSDHTIWAGGIDGIYSSKDSFQRNWGDVFPILNSRIVAIQNGGQNQLWIVTPESGLLMCTVDQGKLIKIVEANKFLKNPIENIQSLFREENGRIWLATNSGIYGINPSNWETLHFNHYDGLANDDVRSVVVSHDTLWAGTASGVTRMVLKPAPLKGDFPTYVTAVRYQQQKTVFEINTLDSIPPGQEILLPSDASLVELEFTGLNYKSRGNLYYECITTTGLLPSQWWTTSNLIDWVWNGFKETYDTTMIYKSSLAYGVTLTPGRYKVNTLAITASGTRSIQSDSCSFIMRPSWYVFLWFHLIIWGILGCLFYYFYQTRVQLREMAVALTQSRLLAFQAQINPHFVGNAINAVQRFFYPPSPMLASLYTATLTRLLRKTLHYSEKFFLPFSEELQYSMDYLELAHQRLGKDKFEYSVIGAEFLRQDLPFPTLFLQPILENATIHGIAINGVTKVEVVFSMQQNRLVCTVQDNGLGISSTPQPVEEVPQEGYMQSKGMKILRRKAEMMNQLYNIDLRISAENLSEKSSSLRGTRFTLSFLTDKVKDASGQLLVNQQNDILST